MQRGRRGRAPARHSGDRVLDRRQRRRARRLSVELPAGVRRQAHRRLRHLAGQAFVRRAAAGQRLWRGGGGRVPAGGGAARRPRRRAGKISARSEQDGRAGRGAWRRRRARSTRIFIPDGADAVPQVVQSLAASGVNLKRVQLLGTGLWDDPRIFSTAALDGGWYAAPESSRLPQFLGRYRARYGQDPVRTATLAYDAVALVAALVKTQGAQRFSEQVLTDVLGLCRHRRHIPLPPRRHQRARPRRAARRAVRRPGRQPGAARRSTPGT